MSIPDCGKKKSRSREVPLSVVAEGKRKKEEKIPRAGPARTQSPAENDREGDPSPFEDKEKGEISSDELSPR